jgi:imidazolonepropionase-like amidohydrolase
LLVLDGDPLADLTTLRAPRMVILNGKILDRDKLRGNAM